MGRKKSLLGMLGITFSWKRALGITAARRKIARATGIPTTKEGRRRKFGPSGAFLIDNMLSSGAEKPGDDTPQRGSSPSVQVDTEPEDFPVDETTSEDVILGCGVPILIYIIGFLSGCIVSALIVNSFRSN